MRRGSIVTRSRAPFPLLADRENADEHSVEASFTVTREGRTANVITNSTDATLAQQKVVLSAVKHARYAPRLLNGEPVSTDGVKLLEKLLTKRSRQPQ